MPSVREQLTTKIIALLEASAEVQADFPRAANRGNADSKTWLRDLIARAPADFRRFTIDFARGTHSMHTGLAGFAMEAEDSEDIENVQFNVDRVFDLTITIKAELPKPGEVHTPEEAILQALFEAGPRLGLPAIVLSVGQGTYDRRDTRADEKPTPGTVTVIRLPITTRESSITLLQE